MTLKKGFGVRRLYVNEAKAFKVCFAVRPLRNSDISQRNFFAKFVEYEIVEAFLVAKTRLG